MTCQIAEANKLVNKFGRNVSNHFSAGDTGLHWGFLLSNKYILIAPHMK